MFDLELEGLVAVVELVLRNNRFIGSAPVGCEVSAFSRLL